MAIVTKLAQALVRAKENKLQAVRCKYHSKKLMKVSDMPELQGEVVTKLAAKDYTDLWAISRAGVWNGPRIEVRFDCTYVLVLDLVKNYLILIWYSVMYWI